MIEFKKNDKLQQAWTNKKTTPFKIKKILSAYTSQSTVGKYRKVAQLFANLLEALLTLAQSSFIIMHK